MIGSSINGNELTSNPHEKKIRLLPDAIHSISSKYPADINLQNKIFLKVEKIEHLEENMTLK